MKQVNNYIEKDSQKWALESNDQMSRLKSSNESSQIIS